MADSQGITQFVSTRPSAQIIPISKDKNQSISFTGYVQHILLFGTFGNFGHNCHDFLGDRQEWGMA